MSIKTIAAAKAKNQPANFSKLRDGAAATSARAALTSVDKPLTNQQRIFAIAYAQGESVTSAMARANYSNSTPYGFRMLQMPNIKALVAEERAKFEEEAGLTRRKVQDMLIEAYDVAKLMSEPSSMVAAARELGRMAGYYEAKKTTVDINVRTGGMLQNLSTASDEVLIAMIEKAAREAAEAEQLRIEASGSDEDEEDEPQ